MKNETARQIVHIVVVGSFAAVSALFSQQVALLLIFAALIAGIVIVWHGTSRVFLALERFDRAHVKIPAKGAFMATVGALLTVLIFPAQATQALLVLALADSLATIAGLRFPSPKLFSSSKKSVVGTATFFVVSLIVLGFSLVSIVISLVLTAVEIGDYHRFKLVDDNLLIPLVAASLLLIL